MAAHPMGTDAGPKGKDRRQNQMIPVVDRPRNNRPPFQNVTNFVEHGQLLFVLPYCSHLIRPVSMQNKNIGEHFVNQK
jgi:hypothetical protein